VALRLVVERDHTIETFIPEEYWTITALFKAAGGEFTARLTQWQGKKPALKNKADADTVLAALRGVSYHIRDVTPKQRQQKPPAPFITSSLQQAASSHLKLSPDLTMKLAQQLYEAGYITYMRTDSPAVSSEGEAMAKATIKTLFGENYLGGGKYGARGNSQEAHECIRPTDTDATPDAIRAALGADGGRAAAVYELIYKRFLASQMANAVFHEVHVNVVGGQAVFSAKGSKLVFDGFLRVYGYSEEKEQVKRADDAENDDETPVNKQLPPLNAGEGVQTLKLTPQQHFTKPPLPYTEALLIKALEQNGVGRPSTFAQTIATIKKRSYVEVEKRQLRATSLGKQVNQVLITRLPGLFEIAFTAQMETALDEIAAGKKNGRDYLRGFWAHVSPLFGPQVIQATITSTAGRTSSSSAADGETPTPKRRTTRKSAARATPATDGETSVPKRRTTRKSVPKAAPAEPISSEYGLCPKCSKPLVKRKGPRGEFLGCSGFPKCRHTSPLTS